MVVSVVVNWTLGVDAEKDACGPFALVFGLLRVYATETPSAPTRAAGEVVHHGYDGEIFRRVRARGVESWTIDARGARGSSRGTW